jgi:predicted membrane channel-forming protein YqfA (hemolysin III family)
LDGLGIRLAINLLVLFVIVRLLYYPKTRRKDYLFTYFLIGIITFFLCFGLKKLDIDTGMGLGLFAIFGIIRYRTDAIEIKEMTYLFLVIGLSVVNAMLATEVEKDIYQINLLELGVINLSVIGVLYVLEYLWLMKHETRKIINYDRVDLIKTENHEALKLDLEARTGLVINRFEIGKIDFLNDTCLIRVYYFAEDQDFSNYGG